MAAGINFVEQQRADDCDFCNRDDIRKLFVKNAGIPLLSRISRRMPPPHAAVIARTIIPYEIQMLSQRNDWRRTHWERARPMISSAVGR